MGARSFGAPFWIIFASQLAITPAAMARSVTVFKLLVWTVRVLTLNSPNRRLHVEAQTADWVNALVVVGVSGYWSIG